MKENYTDFTLFVKQNHSDLTLFVSIGSQINTAQQIQAVVTMAGFWMDDKSD